MSGETFLTWPFRQSYSIADVQKDCQNRKQEIGYMPLEHCPFLMTAYFLSLFFPVAMVLIQRRREKAFKSINISYYPPCFCSVCGRCGIWSPECGIRNLSNGTS